MWEKGVGGLYSFSFAKSGPWVWRVKCEVGLLVGVD